jgi:TIR domain
VQSNEGHAFISYVREDSERVDRLQTILEAAGVRVWRDTEDLWPGEDWRMNIRRAITTDALAFVVCFSRNSESRRVSGLNEELMLAVDQLRLRRPDQPWLIPVRLDDVSIPTIDIGGGRTLESIQWVDLTADNWDQGAARLVAGVVRILQGTDPSPPRTPADSVGAQVKAALRDPTGGDIALNDALTFIATEVQTELLADDLRPDTSEELKGSVGDAALSVSDLAEKYMAAMDPALDALIYTAQWAREDQCITLTRFVERLVPSPGVQSGMVVLLDLRWLPLLPLLYAGGLASLHQGNYRTLKAIAIDATVRDPSDGRIPLIARGNPWRPFRHLELVPQVLALRADGQEATRAVVEDLHSGRRGKRYTPVSDYLHGTLRERFRVEVPDDDDYSELFDLVETFLALLAIDIRSQQAEGDRRYLDGPYYGRTRWRGRYYRGQEGPEVELLRQVTSEGPDWPPIKAGLFGGSLERATSAIESFSREANEARSRTF